MDFTVVKIILDHFTEFKLYKNLDCLLSLHVYGNGIRTLWPMVGSHAIPSSGRNL